MTFEPSRRAFVLGALGAASLGIAGKSFAQGRAPTKEAVFADREVPVIGNPSGDVTIVEWFDYQCPFCKQAFAETLALVRADGNIRYLMKDWPILGPESVYAAKLTLAIPSARGHAQAQAALMSTRGRLTRDRIDDRLRSAGADPAGLIAAYEKNSRRIDALLWRNGEQAYGLGLNATPGYMIGTTLFRGALYARAMREAVARART